MTPLLAGALATACFTVALLAVPLLLDRGPVDRLAARTGAQDVERRRSLLRRLIERLAARLGPRLAPGIRLSRREAIARRLDLAGRPGGLSRAALRRAQGRAVPGRRRLLRLPRADRRLVAAGASSRPARAGSRPTSCSRASAGCARSASSATSRTSSTSSPSPSAPGWAIAPRCSGWPSRSAGPAGEEILTALRQMDLGASRRDAFLALRARNESEALSTFIGAQLQAEELGVPLSEALNDIAIDMRRSAAQNARRRAARAAPRISLIVTTLIVPGLDHPHPRVDDPRHRHPRLRGARRWLTGSSSAARAAPAAGSSRPARASSRSARGSS